jgi:chromodomain-helicase-DNA-binding protein 7
VQVYRLVTARTYEAEMFDRASKKLGLDQAIFSGKFQERPDFKDKDARVEIEKLLKHGIYGVMDEDTTKSESFVESNIDQILENNSRVVNYSVIRGTYSLAKSSFVSCNADETLDMNDPNFWSKVLSPQTSTINRLLT